MAELSPMMKQYFKIKEQNPGSILFFRLGDFYEMFYDDAKLASRELDLTLTGRDCGQDERAPMCGVPYHSCEAYIARLVEKGYKVSICEQTEDPANAKGLVNRDVIRVITPGTVTESSMLDETSNNYLAAVCVIGNSAGVCFVDASTGKLYLTELKSPNLIEKINTELGTFLPREVILNREASELKKIEEFVKEKLSVMCSLEDGMRFDPVMAETVVKGHFDTSLAQLDLCEGAADMCALGGALSYLTDTRKTNLQNINKLEKYSNTQFMRLDLASVRNLEIFETIRNKNKRGSLFWAIDNTVTAMGKRLLRSWLEHPLVNPVPILARQNAVGELFSDMPLCSDLREHLTGIHDLERLITRVIYASANPQELLSLAFALEKLPAVKELLKNSKSQLLCETADKLDDFSEICDLVKRGIREDAPLQVRDGGIIKEGYSEDLDSVRGDVGGAKDIIAEIEQREKDATGIKNLKIGYNRVFGYYIEVTNSYKSLVPEGWIRKQTLSNCERYITEELKKVENRLLGARDKSIALEYELFCEIRTAVANEYLKIQSAAEGVATLDVICSFASNAVRGGYICPEIATDGIIKVTDSRHPVVEKLTDSPFVPNDVLIDTTDNRCCIITGPNMAGKSTYMRQAALICVLAQMGSFVPARSAHIGIVDAVFTRIGASDDLSSGQSTFMVEMSEVANILENATKDSLILLDEIGRGTSTYDGMAIAKAVLEYVISRRKLGARTLFATHYHELTALEGQLDGVVNYNVAIKKRGDDITFLHRIVRGGADRSYGIEVARLAGINPSVVSRAKEILKELESGNPSKDTPQKPDYRISRDEPSQISFTDTVSNEITEELKRIDVNSLTPIEALGILFNLSKKAKG